MPLVVKLKPHEKVIIGSEVICNGPVRSEFTILSESSVLREQDVFTEETANTPARRIYYVVQLMLLRGNFSRSTDIHPLYFRYVNDFITACPNEEVFGIASMIGVYVYNDEFFKALKECRKLISYEDKVFEHAKSIGLC